jgi:NAD(P)H-dependent FMN reductase
MSQIIGISGSLRIGSYNSALLRAAAGLFPDNIKHGVINDIPLYNADVEAMAIPEAVLRLKQQLMDADGLLLVSPEYNQSVPGVAKNAVDWLSRPSMGISNVFRDKPVAVMGTSTGAFGTVSGQNAWFPVFRGLGAKFWNGGRLMVPHASSVFDDLGNLIDESIEQRLQKFIEEFISFCEP